MLYNKARKRKGMKHMNIKAAIWDLDGTLLNTLDDLAASTNAALDGKRSTPPTHTVDEVRVFCRRRHRQSGIGARRAGWTG